MFKLFRDSFRATNEGIILATPLVLFMWLISLYIMYSKEVVDTIPEFILSAVTILFMTSAFCSGWFYMAKKCVEFSKKNFILDKDKASESLNLIQAFPVGIGKYFLTYIIVSVMFILGVLLVSVITYHISLPFIREINFSMSQMNTVINSSQELINFFNSLSPEQLGALLKLNFCFACTTSLFLFFIMLWMPEIIYRDKNPIIALFTSIYKLFVKFGKSLLLFIYINFLNISISFLSTFAFLHPIAYMIMTIIYFYFIVYVIVLIFSYYDEEFNKPEEIETQSDSDSRSDR